MSVNGEKECTSEGAMNISDDDEQSIQSVCALSGGDKHLDRGQGFATFSMCM